MRKKKKRKEKKRRYKVVGTQFTDLYRSPSPTLSLSTSKSSKHNSQVMQRAAASLTPHSKIIYHHIEVTLELNKTNLLESFTTASKTTSSAYEKAIKAQ